MKARQFWILTIVVFLWLKSGEADPFETASM